MKEKDLKMGFEELNLSKKVLKIVSDLGFEEPTPVQREAIPKILEGRNLLAQAPTGTGKTLAFGLPLMDMIKKKKYPNALVLVPTRELCIQVAQELNRVGMKLGILSLPVYGGQSIENQIRALKKGVQIVVGTPGRIIDHIERRTLNLSEASYLVLDEADEMLDMGFEEDIERILKNFPIDSQRLLFSATIPQPILAIANKYIHNYDRISLSRENIVVPNIKQIFYEVRENDKLDVLTKILDMEGGELILIFCHTKKETDEVAYALKSRGYLAEPLHGDYSQAQREKVMDRFRKKRINIMVATDVAARGIDVSGVSHVINYSIPQNPESYVHRIGRTGRAGKEGIAITLVTPREYKRIQEIEKITKSKIKKSPAPNIAELIDVKKNSFISRLKAVKLSKTKDIAKIKEEFAKHFSESELLDMLVASFLIHAGLDAETNERRESGIKRLFVTIGKKDGVLPKDIFKALIDKAEIKGDDIGRINIHDKFTFVEVKEEVAEKVIEAIDSFVVKGKAAKIMHAKEKAK
ncbi:MAG: DEAD/DEAH box helicase [bacterium]